MKKLVVKKDFVIKTSLAILLTGFVMFYFADGVGKILRRSGSDFYRYSAFVKGIFEIIILIFSAITINKSKLNIFYSILILTGLFLIGQFFLSLNFKDLNFFENFNTLFKYFFLFIFALLAIDIIQMKRFPVWAWKIYKNIIILNAGLILVGFILDVDFLRTYEGPWRFGFDGLIVAQNEATFIFIFAVTIAYYRRFYQGINEYFFWIVLVASLFVATKAIYLFIILLFFYHLFIKVSLKNILIFGLSFGLIGYLLFATLINAILLNSYEVFMYVYRTEGLTYALFSGRNVFIEAKLLPLISEQWTIFNFFVGGQDVVAHYIEMGFIDLFLFFGFFGFILYLFVFYQIFKLLPFKGNFQIFFALTLGLIIATAGHFFESGIAGIHFIMMIIILRNYSLSKTTESES